MSWGKTSTWFGGYGNKEEKISPIQTDTSKNARRYGSTSAKTTVEPKNQTWLSSLLDTTGVVRSDLYKGGEEDPQSGGGLANYAAPVVNEGRKSAYDSVATAEILNSKYGQEFGIAKGANGEPITVNGVPYVDRFNTTASEAGVGTTMPVENPLNSITPESTIGQDIDIAQQILDMIEKIKNDPTADNDAIARNKEILDALGAQYADAMALLNSKYANLKSMLDSERSVAEQRAAISNAKLLKYLPEQLKSVGLYGVGTSQGAFLKAANMYQNQLSETQREYLKQLMEAENAYMSGAASASSSYNSAVANAKTNLNNILASNKQSRDSRIDALNASLLNYYAGQEDKDFQLEMADKNREATLEYYEKQKEDNEKAAADTALYNYALDAFNNGAFETENDVNNFMIKSGAGNLYNGVLNNYADNYNNTLKKLEEAEAARVGGAYTSDVELGGVNSKKGYEGDTVKFTVEKNGKAETYKVKLGEEVSHDSDVYYHAQEMLASKTNTMFVYDGQLFYYAPNKKVVEVEDNKKQENLLYNYLTGSKQK